MPLRSGKPYLLGESSEFPVDSQQVAAMFAAIQAKLETLITIEERLSKVEVCLENCNKHKEEHELNRNKHEEHGLFIPYQSKTLTTNT